MRSEFLVGVLNVLGVVCIVGGPEVTSIAVSAVCGSGFFAMSLGVVLVDSVREISGRKESRDGAK